MKNKKKMNTINLFITLKTLILFVCAIVGVGFVSGAEIYEFFLKFGDTFFVGIVIFCVLVLVLTYKILNKTENQNFEIKMQKIIKNNTKNTFYIKTKSKNILIFFNSTLMSAAMFSGLKVLMKNLFFNNYIFVFVLIIIALFLIELFGVKGLEKLDFFVIIFLCFLSVYFANHIEFGLVSNSFCAINKNYSFSDFLITVFYAVSYVFMNIVSLQPLAKEMNANFGKKGNLIFSILFSVFLGLTLLIFCLMLKSNINFAEFDMPFLEYFCRQGKYLKYIFSFGLLIALLSSLISSMVGVKRFILNFLSKNICDKKFLNIFSTTFSLVIIFILSFIPFKFFVSIVYPIIGIINFIIFVFL